MRKSEMTLQQRQERESFKQTLIDANWGNNEGWDFLFEQDHRLTPEALGEHEAAFFSFRLLRRKQVCVTGMREQDRGFCAEHTILSAPWARVYHK
jgi:hypothetical protein